MNELISVILPVYNGEKYLKEAIESILNQTYTNFEFIIIDDGSKDSSLEIIKEYEKEDERIVVVSRENKGLIATLNEGIEKAKGKYIARMDQDDISLPNRFEEQLKFLEKNPEIGVCGTWVEVFGENRNSTLWKMPIKDEELRPRLLFSVTFAHPSVMMRKGLINQYNLRYNEKYINAEEYKFWLDLSEFTKFGNIPKKLLLYRYHDASISRVADNAKDEQRYQTMKSIFSEILSKLDIINSEAENRLHFVITYNEKMLNTDIDVKDVIVYINKILNFNQEIGFFDKKQLKQYLYKKIFILIFYKIKNFKFQGFKNLMNICFWSGLSGTLIEKIRMKFSSWTYK